MVTENGLSNLFLKPVDQWTNQDVMNWLDSKGFYNWSDYIAIRHKIDGRTLLTLREEDLRHPPLSMDCLGDIKQLSIEMARLQQTFSGNCITNHQEVDEMICIERTIFQEEKSLEVDGKVGLSRDHLIRCVESPDTKEKSLIKLLLAFIYCSISLLITSFVMVVVHDRVPNMKMYPPLPDIVLDNIPLIPWAFECCEVIGIIMTVIWTVVLIFHKHRIVIMRRMFSITGTIFLLRCVTMLITSLSVPGIHLECQTASYGEFYDKLKQAFHIWSHLGMSIQGVRTCGDYMFSGHTATITLLNHFITEYTPDDWRGLHTLVWVMNIFGTFFILAGHEHYSIDVFIAFYITSRMFLSYHANAYNYANMTSMDSRVRIWFPLGWFFESGGVGRLENVFEIPKIFNGISSSENTKVASKFDLNNNSPINLSMRGSFTAISSKSIDSKGSDSIHNVRRRKGRK